jgi:L-seryl-tRNA(Ser) seleniumtransferase
MLTDDGRPPKGSLNRRGLLKTGAGALGGAALVRNQLTVAAGAPMTDQPPGDIYETIGVRPLINCKGTFTIITGSLTLPEVKKAMDEASKSFVHLDELMEAVGRRLSSLTGAEWGIVTAGCSAALTLATCACLAGGSPEKVQRLPDLRGMEDEVVIPNWSRNVYDQAIRMLGVRIITPDSLESLETALGPRTAMVYILAGSDDTGKFGLEAIARIARRFGVPVLVDAAAENLTPQVHFRRGADLVGYSGGKALRGPQCAGLLLGRKDLCQAAWIHSAPHHAFGRSLKVGKEEIMGMLAAVETWYQRDHDGEWKTWESWLGEIAREVEKIGGVRTEVVLPDSLSNRTPSLRVSWDGLCLGVSGQEVFDSLLQGNPRIHVHSSTGTRRQSMDKSSVTVVAWMMQPGQATVVAKALHQALSTPRPGPTAPLGPPSADVSGRWEADLTFCRGGESHTLFFEQSAGKLSGTHYGELLKGRLEGWLEGDEIDFRSVQPLEGNELGFHFHGKLQGDSMSGTVNLGEYGRASWTARRARPARSEK